MTKTIGQIITTEREKRSLSRTELAKKIDLSPGYLGHLERDGMVPLSEGLRERIQKSLSITIPATIVKTHNERAARWYKNYISKRKK